MVFVAALAMAAGALAVDVQLKDGTVIHAASYQVQGSYVIVRLENGSQAAYDVADVDLDAMRASEKKAAPPEAPKPSAPSNAFAGAMAANRGKAAMTITDQDVSHVETSAPGKSPAAEKKKPLADHEEGGQVVVQGVRVEPGKDNVTWRATGQVVNRMSDPVMDVRVVVQATGPNSKVYGEAELPVAATLGPGKAGSFSHTFTASARPLLRVRVFWMQRAKTAPTPGAGRGAGAKPPLPGRSGPAGSGAAAAPSSGASGTTAESTKAVGGGKPPSLQWGGAPAYKRSGSGARPTPWPY